MTNQSTLRLPNDKEVWLVQRLLRNPYGESDDTRSGVDRHFSMDYMGSAEFEFGALPKSLARMQEANYGDLQPQEVTFIYSGPTLPAVNRKVKKFVIKAPEVITGSKLSFFYIGPPEYVKALREGFTKLAHNRYAFQMKELMGVERTYNLDPNYRGDPYRYSESVPVGWWDISNDWMAFTKEEFAFKFLEGLRAKKAA